jgi:hypothetical protein
MKLSTYTTYLNKGQQIGVQSHNKNKKTQQNPKALKVFKFFFYIGIISSIFLFLFVHFKTIKENVNTVPSYNENLNQIDKTNRPTSYVGIINVLLYLFSDHNRPRSYGLGSIIKRFLYSQFLLYILNL